MIYRTICTQLWTDKKIQQLTVQGKLLFVYLITNPHTHLSGIYYLPKELITKETGLSNTLSDTLFYTLSEMERAYYDPETSTVFVVNMFGYQGTGEKNERSAANQLKGLHDTPLIGLFLERYPSVKQFCANTLLDTVSTLSKRFPSVPSPVLLTSSPSPKTNLKSKPHALSESEWIESLKTNVAYQHVDFAVEWGKMDAWLATRPGRKRTKRFVLDWLNRIEVPLTGNAGSGGKQRPPPPPPKNDPIGRGLWGRTYGDPKEHGYD